MGPKTKKDDCMKHVLKQNYLIDWILKVHGKNDDDACISFYVY
jgi:hypothetical protein